jgi:hypothetical protein
MNRLKIKNDSFSDASPNNGDHFPDSPPLSLLLHPCHRILWISPDRL